MHSRLSPGWRGWRQTVNLISLRRHHHPPMTCFLSVPADVGLRTTRSYDKVPRPQDRMRGGSLGTEHRNRQRKRLPNATQRGTTIRKPKGRDNDGGVALPLPLSFSLTLKTLFHKLDRCLWCTSSCVCWGALFSRNDFICGLDKARKRWAGQD